MKYIVVRYIALFLAISICGYYDHPLVIEVASRNNREWLEQHFDSIRTQTYTNWRIIYIDDASTDGTADAVMEYVTKYNLEDRITLIRNSVRKGALANHYRAIHMCDDWEIVCQLDGDDWFADNNVLKIINDAYQDENVWVTYGSFIDWPTDRPGYCKPLPDEVVKKQLFRETYWTPGQLRTFYAWLFKKIKLEDFLWDHWDEHYGKFYPAACDLALSYPLMEMAGTHFKFIEDIVYIHNVKTPFNDFKVNRIPQIVASNVLLYKRKYTPVKDVPVKVKASPYYNSKSVDVFIYMTEIKDSKESKNNTQKLIDECRKNISPLNKLCLINVEKITITEYGNDGQTTVRSYDSIKTLLLKELHNWWKSSEYVLFIDEKSRVSAPFNVLEPIKALEDAQAYAYFPSLRVSSTVKSAPYTLLDEATCVWRLAYLDRQWMRGPSYFNVLMHKKNIRERITYLDDELIKNTLLKNVFAPGMLMIQDVTITRIGMCATNQSIT